MQPSRSQTQYGQAGFTLVELMVALAISFLIIGAVYASYKVQQQNSNIQQQVTEVQQNLRAAMDILTRDFMVVGYDPTVTGNYGITTATATRFEFTADMCEDGGDAANCAAPTPLERYDYNLYVTSTADANDTTSLRREAGGQAIADNIEQVEFLYIIDNGTQSPTPNLANQTVIGIMVSLLARADEPDYEYTDANTYTTLSGAVWNPATFTAGTCPNANCLNYRRRLLTKTIYLRNS